MFPQYPNPVNDFYFRNAAMQQANFQQAQAVPQFPPQPQTQNPNNQLVCRYVTNHEEAKAAMVDALNTYIFLDTANGKIYLKRMSNNGLSDFYTYIIEENKTEQEKSDPFKQINERLSNIENSLGVIINDKSVQSNATVSKSAKSVKSAASSENAANGTAESTSISEGA